MFNWVLVAFLRVLVIVVPILKPDGQPSEVLPQTGSSISIEFTIQQDINLIRQSLFGEPPQFAIWLEDPQTHQLKTVFVTYRSGFGHWIGKTECPAALPRWFEVFKEETHTSELPSFDQPAPDAVTGATPGTEDFKTSVEVKQGSQWICWIEMNLAGDLNETFLDHDVEKKMVDVHLSGQPALLYRGEITAIPGEKMVPILHGQSSVGNSLKDKIKPVSEGVTTARNVFKQINIQVVKHG